MTLQDACVCIRVGYILLYLPFRQLMHGGGTDTVTPAISNIVIGRVV
mgnify:CR=1 FL=1